jgi:UDPglucose 6-dehydrogenase
MRIGIVGNGYVGKATALLKCEDVNVVIYDKNPDLCMPLGISLTSLIDCDFILVCVPTPMRPDGSCDVSIVDSVVEGLSDKYPTGRIIVRSTVPVGTCKRLGTMFLPEFLTEKNWENDFRNNFDWVLGWDQSRTVADEFYDKVLTSAYNCKSLKNNPRAQYCTTEEAELTKYIRNAFLATKVSFFNEIQSFCIARNMDYDTVKRLVANDKRIGSSHMAVPGPDGKRGFGGTCFAKDLASLQFQMRAGGVPTIILDSAKYRNETIDRPKKDWELDRGRAVI